MVKNKIKKGTLLVYVDEYGNQKAVDPDDLLVTDGKTKVTLSVVLTNLTNAIDTINNNYAKLNDEFLSFKSKQIQNTSDILDNQSVHNKKIETLSNDVKALLSINKKN